MKYTKFKKGAPNVPARSRSGKGTGNARTTPVESVNVPYVPYVPEKVIDTYTPPCVCVDIGDEKNTHHTKRCKGGVLVSKTGNAGTLGDSQVVERVPGTGNNRERKQGQTGNVGTETENTPQNVPQPDAQTADPTLFLDQIITQPQMDTLQARGRAEGFGVWGQWMTDEWPCEWRVVKVEVAA